MTTEHMLYKAAVGMMAGERLDTESWEQVAMFAHQHQGDAGGLKTEFKLVEEQIKADFSISAMPGRWRSAKSAALKAVIFGIPLVDGEGKVFGKSAIERAAKNAIPATTPSTTAAADIAHIVDVLSKMPLPAKWDTVAQRADVLTRLQDVYSKFMGIK